MTCPGCGSSVASGDAFCGGCGTRLGGGDGQAPAQELVPPTPPPPPNRPPRASEPIPGAAATHRSPADSPVLGESIPNAHYTGMRLLYKDGEAESLDPLNWQFTKALIFHWFIAWGVSFAVVAVLMLLGVRSPDGLGFLWLLVLVVFAFLPVLVSISEWKFMVDGKAEASSETFAHIAWVMSQRQTPIDKLDVRRVRLGRQVSRDYLYAGLRPFRAYVSCFPFGSDLYVGWTFWWRLSTVRWWLLIIQRLFQTITLRGSEIHSVHRYDHAKALREAIHSATREGVDAATGAIAFQGSGTIGTEIPIETVELPEGHMRDRLTGG